MGVLQALFGDRVNLNAEKLNKNNGKPLAFLNWPR